MGRTCTLATRGLGRAFLRPLLRAAAARQSCRSPPCIWGVGWGWTGGHEPGFGAVEGTARLLSRAASGVLVPRRGVSRKGKQGGDFVALRLGWRRPAPDTAGKEQLCQRARPQPGLDGSAPACRRSEGGRVSGPRMGMEERLIAQRPWGNCICTGKVAPVVELVVCRARGVGTEERATVHVVAYLPVRQGPRPGRMAGSSRSRQCPVYGQLSVGTQRSRWRGNVAGRSPRSTARASCPSISSISSSSSATPQSVASLSRGAELRHPLRRTRMQGPYGVRGRCPDRR